MATKIIDILVQNHLQYAKGSLLHNMLQSYPNIDVDHLVTYVQYWPRPGSQFVAAYIRSNEAPYWLVKAILGTTLNGTVVLLIIFNAWIHQSSNVFIRLQWKLDQKTIGKENNPGRVVSWERYGLIFPILRSVTRRPVVLLDIALALQTSHRAVTCQQANVSIGQRKSTRLGTTRTQIFQRIAHHKRKKFQPKIQVR